MAWHKLIRNAWFSIITDHTSLLVLLTCYKVIEQKCDFYQICLFCIEVEGRNSSPPVLEIIMLLYYQFSALLLSVTSRGSVQ